jgi:hypothetical protein
MTWAGEAKGGTVFETDVAVNATPAEIDAISKHLATSMNAVCSACIEERQGNEDKSGIVRNQCVSI